jgi:hypothetical protein
LSLLHATQMSTPETHKNFPDTERAGVSLSLMNIRVQLVFSQTPVRSVGKERRVMSKSLAASCMHGQERKEWERNKKFGCVEVAYLYIHAGHGCQVTQHKLQLTNIFARRAQRKREQKQKCSKENESGRILHRILMNKQGNYVGKAAFLSKVAPTFYYPTATDTTIGEKHPFPHTRLYIQSKKPIESHSDASLGQTNNWLQPSVWKMMPRS